MKWRRAFIWTFLTMCVFAMVPTSCNARSKWTRRVKSSPGGKHWSKRGALVGKNRGKVAVRVARALTFSARSAKGKAKLARPILKVLVHRRGAFSLFPPRVCSPVPVRIHVWANCKLSEHSARGEGGRVCSTNVGRSSALTFACECFSFPRNVQEPRVPRRAHTKKLRQHLHREQS